MIFKIKLVMNFKMGELNLIFYDDIQNMYNHIIDTIER